MNKISCIICAHNEEKRISVVLGALKNHPLVNEVIVVDDGSTDKTKEVVGLFAFVKLISHETNKGKSGAMATGIKEAKYDTLMFLDADILSITAEDIIKLALPILEKKADVSMSVRRNSLLIYKAIGLDFVSGERVISKKYLLDHIETISGLPGYGIEVFMNRIIIKNKLRVRIVKWNNVTIAGKADKIGFWKGNIGELLMIKEIMKVASLGEMLAQNYQILRLSRKTKHSPDLK